MMIEKARHKRAYRLFRGLLSPILRRMFNYSFPVVNDIEGPYIVLANHNLELDPILVAMAFPKQMYFVASEHIMRKGFGTWFLMRYAKPIIRKKGKVEVRTVAEILKTLKAGGNVCIFAEGARSFNGLTRNIQPSTGKLVRRSGATLITYRLQGGYFSQPRWSTTLRKGKMTGTVSGIYTADTLQAMTEAEVNQLIAADLFEDAYQTQAQEQIAFKGKHLALGMESTLFACPVCKNLNTLHSDDHGISCTCGAKYTYTEQGDLLSAEGETMTITQWDLWQQDHLQQQFQLWKATDEPQPCFSDEVTLYQIDKDHKVLEETRCTLTAYTDRIQCGQQSFYYQDMLGLDIFSRNFIVMHYGSGAQQYEIKGDLMFCALKYMYLYEIAKGLQA